MNRIRARVTGAFAVGVIGALVLTACSSGGSQVASHTPTPPPSASPSTSTSSVSSSASPTAAPTAPVNPSAKPSVDLSKMDFNERLLLEYPDAAANFIPDAKRLMSLFYGGGFGDFFGKREGDDSIRYETLVLPYLTESAQGRLMEHVKNGNASGFASLVLQSAPDGLLNTIGKTKYYVDEKREPGMPVFIPEQVGSGFANFSSAEPGSAVFYQEKRKVTVLAKGDKSFSFVAQYRLVLRPDANGKWLIDGWSAETIEEPKEDG